MDPVTTKLMSAAGAAAGPTYVDDVFSTDLSTGTSANKTITNGIDLAGEGGMVWNKGRSHNHSNWLYDTERGANLGVRSNTADAAHSDTEYFHSFNSDGYTIGSNGSLNYSGVTYATWTFRKCPGFFDVVTWTGNGVNGRQISHSLGSTPGCIFVKKTSDSANWEVWHRSIGDNYFLRLNSTNAKNTSAPWNNTSPTSTHFTVSSDGDVNGSSATYVAYIFAHNDQSFGENEDESIIKCGSFNSTGSVVNIDLGFEPQWILVKRSDASNSWVVVDNMRGNPVGAAAKYIEPNSNQVEGTLTGWTVPTPTGFTNNYPISGGEFIYIAIRRPHKPPEAATDVFDVQTHTSDVNGVLSSSTITADALLSLAPDSSTYNNILTTRLLEKYLETNTKAAPNSGSQWAYDEQTGIRHTDWFGAQNIVDYTFKRAPGFFDVVTYTGNGVQGRNITHNLGVAPDLMIVKNRSTTNDDWHVYVSGITHLSVYGSDPDNYGSNAARLYLNGSDAAQFSASGSWDHAHPTATTFRVGDTGGTNGNNEDLVAYLFANLDGICKIGSYTGTGSAQNLDFGFSNGTRFFMLKRVDDSQNWHIFDSARGIVAGNEAAIPAPNTKDAAFSGDYVDPYSAGITLAGSTFNGSGHKYIYLAIA